MWTCKCGHCNSCIYDKCVSCNEEIPQKERNIIYRRELEEEYKSILKDFFTSSLFIFVSKSLKVLYSIFVYIISAIAGVFEGLWIIAVQIFKMYPVRSAAIVIVVVFLTLCKMVQHTPFEREAIRVRYDESAERRTEYTEIAGAKLSKALQNFDFSDMSYGNELISKENIRKKSGLINQRCKSLKETVFETVRKYVREVN